MSTVKIDADGVVTLDNGHVEVTTYIRGGTVETEVNPYDYADEDGETYSIVTDRDAYKSYLLALLAELIN